MKSRTLLPPLLHLAIWLQTPHLWKDGETCKSHTLSFNTVITKNEENSNLYNLLKVIYRLADTQGLTKQSS